MEQSLLHSTLQMVVVFLKFVMKLHMAAGHSK
jgi:hypothetical protein